MPKCHHNLWGVMRYRSTKSRSVTDARHSSELFSLFMFETWFNEVVWKCDRWPQTEESQLASQLQNCREYWLNLAIMDHFCNAGDSNLAPTAGSAKISDSKTKISGVEENLKVLTSKTKAAWERIGGWFITHQEPGGCDCLRRSSNQPALYLPKSRNWVRPRSLHWWANSTS